MYDNPPILMHYMHTTHKGSAYAVFVFGEHQLHQRFFTKNESTAATSSQTSRKQYQLTNR